MLAQQGVWVLRELAPRPCRQRFAAGRWRVAFRILRLGQAPSARARADAKL